MCSACNKILTINILIASSPLTLVLIPLILLVVVVAVLVFMVHFRQSLRFKYCFGKLKL